MAEFDRIYNFLTDFLTTDEPMKYEYFGYSTMETVDNITGKYEYLTEAVKIKTLLGKWNHVCHTVQFMLEFRTEFQTFGNLTEKVYFNGGLEYKAEKYGLYYHTWYEGMFIIGGVATNFEFNKLDSTQSFAGKITDFNFWNRTLTLEEVKSLANCTSDLKGDLITWTPEGVEETLEVFGNISMVETDLDEICNEKEHLLSAQIIFPQLNHKDSEDICKAVGGEQTIG